MHADHHVDLVAASEIASIFQFGGRAKNAANADDLDIRGAGGREYLWGASCRPVETQSRGGEFLSWWAHDRQQERTAFEAFVDWTVRRVSASPGMHIYHYGR